MKHTCDILEEAFKRYYSIILKSNGMEPVLKNHNGTINSNSTHEWKQNSGFSGYLDVLNVYLFDPCEAWPHHEMDESCMTFLHLSLSLCLGKKTFKMLNPKLMCIL